MKARRMADTAVMAQRMMRALESEAALSMATLVVFIFAAGGCASLPEDGRPLTDAESATVAVCGPVPGVLVCELVGRDEVLQVRATKVGTRYTVCSLDGQIVEQDLDAAELSRIRPDLNPDAMQADWGFGPVMMVDVGG